MSSRCNPHDMVGRKFNKLTVVEICSHRNHRGRMLVLCQCECGTLRYITPFSVANGKTKSCGCLRMENVLKAVVKHGCARIKSATKEYRAWNAMTSRCLNKTCDDYPTYGGRGISICDRWVGEHGFENFLSDMGKKPNGRYSLDRIDVNGNYEPSNCRWADDYQQASNRRNLRMIELNGECRHMSEWARMAGIPTSTMQARLTRGWPIDKAISTPLNKNKRLKKNSNLANAGGE